MDLSENIIKSITDAAAPLCAWDERDYDCVSSLHFSTELHPLALWPLLFQINWSQEIASVFKVALCGGPSYMNACIPSFILLPLCLNLPKVI